jgi:hypothetical protein
MNIDELLPKVQLATEKRKLAWGGDLVDVYEAVLGDQKLRVEYALDDSSDEPFYRFSIYKIRNNMLDPEVFLDRIVADRYRGPYSELERLFAEARRSALGLDQVMLDIDSKLDDLLLEF